MSQGASHYPISQLITRIMTDSGPSRSQFVTSLGYRNIERGLRRLDPWINQGEGFERIIKQIAAAYPGRAEELRQAIAATEAIKVAEADAVFLERCKAEQPTFVPFIHAHGESRIPNGITIFGVTGGHRRWTTVQIPEAILNLPLEEQLQRLPELMKAYLKEYRGACPFFGNVVGFRFVRLLDYFQFDKEGQFIERVNKPFRLGSCSVSLR